MKINGGSFNMMKALNESAESELKIKKQVLMESNKVTTNESTWAGVPNTKHIWNGEWSDPQVEYKGLVFNEYDLQAWLNDDYNEDVEDQSKVSFEDWVKEHNDEVYGVLESLYPDEVAGWVLDKIDNCLTSEELNNTLNSFRETTLIPDKIIDELLQMNDSSNYEDEEDRLYEITPEIIEVLENKVKEGHLFESVKLTEDNEKINKLKDSLKWYENKLRNLMGLKDEPGLLSHNRTLIADYQDKIKELKNEIKQASGITEACFDDRVKAIKKNLKKKDKRLSDKSAETSAKKIAGSMKESSFYNTPKEVSVEDLNNIIETREPNGKFYAIDNGIYVAVDNLYGDAWTEEFDSKEKAIKWLNRETSLDESALTESVKVKSYDHRDYGDFRSDIIQGVLEDGRQFISGDYDNIQVYKKGYNAIARLNDKANTDDEDLIDTIEKEMASNEEDLTTEEYDLINNTIYKSNDLEESLAKKSNIQGLEDYFEDDIKQIISDYIVQTLNDMGLTDDDISIKGINIYGSRGRGTARDDSDLDVVVEYTGDGREDDLFNALNYPGEELYIEGIKVDINPINAERSGDMDSFMARAKEYDKNKLNENVPQHNFAVQRNGINQGVYFINKEEAEDFIKEMKSKGLDGDYKIVSSNKANESSLSENDDNNLKETSMEEIRQDSADKGLLEPEAVNETDDNYDYYKDKCQKIADFMNDLGITPDTVVDNKDVIDDQLNKYDLEMKVKIPNKVWTIGYRTDGFNELGTISYMNIGKWDFKYDPFILKPVKESVITEATVSKDLHEVKSQGNIFMLQDNDKYIVGENYDSKEKLIENAEIYNNKEEADKDYLKRCGVEIK